MSQSVYVDESNLTLYDSLLKQAIASLYATKTFVGSIPGTASATDVVGYVDEEVAKIAADLAGVFHFKGTVATVADLPATNNENGDVYHVTAASAEYVWLVPSGGTGAWEELGSIIDLSAYSTTEQMNAAIASAIATEIAKLDATVTQSAGADGLALSVTEVDGKLTGVTGSIAPNTYDAYGAAATAKGEVIGESTDTASANTIHGAKAYADSLGSNYDAAGAAATAAAGVVGQSGDTASDDTVYGAKAYADSLGSNYDAAGAASTAAAGVVGQSGDTASDDTVYGAKAYADSLATNYATSAQGAKADTALQPEDIRAMTESEIRALFTSGS